MADERAGRRVRRQRGSVAAEYLALAGVIVSALGAAGVYVKTQGATLEHAVMKPVEQFADGR